MTVIAIQGFERDGEGPLPEPLPNPFPDPPPRAEHPILARVRREAEEATERRVRAEIAQKLRRLSSDIDALIAEIEPPGYWDGIAIAGSKQ